ncbi:BAR domain-containing protein [Caenorhabditis elegans]|uniref:BAR domain-containing protein n=1 Tax=Caenorhabditis elegans TaxID=6239 RepID=Q23061_CAEEL|nr:BAR domain-containing protein [Caenorhabditis elegans]CCD63840.1 BAR domain-containing protein [Caenorhabditis elegans]|eukprot:NP_500703.1 Uncharacterized protein CELE_T28H11.7 [Caenorhabditis elegans]
MFGRLKQKVKEKTGRAKATTLPAEVDDAMGYFKNLTPRVKDLHKSMTNLEDISKWQKKASFSGTLENYSRLGDKINVKPFMDAVDARMGAEADAVKGVLAICEKYKSFYQNEGKLHADSIANLNRTRLDMDSAADKYANNETEVNKTRLDNSTTEFEVACERMRELANGIKTIESNHSSWQDGLMKEIKVALRK